MKRKRNYELRPEAVPTACQSSKVSPPFTELTVDQLARCGPFSPYAHGLRDSDKITVEVMEGGGRRVNWPLSGPDLIPDELDLLDQPRPEKDDLERLRARWEQSTKSRLRAAWTIGNANCDWHAMTTLTYPISRRPDDYEETKRHRHAFLKRTMKAYPGTLYAWILEFTKCGAAHYHFFWGGTIGEAIKSGELETVYRSGFDGGEKAKTKILRGDLDKRIVGWWRNQAGDGSDEFERFQNGGITELIRSPDGAARYAAKEASKRAQKISPFPVSQWWGMSNKARPKLESTFEITVGDYVDQFGPVMYRHLFTD